MSENNDEEQEIVAVVDYDLSMQPDEEFGPGGPEIQENPATQNNYTEHNPESLESAAERFGIPYNYYYDDREDDMGVQIHHDYTMDNRFETSRYVTLTEEGENIAKQWGWYNGKDGIATGLRIHEIHQNLLPPTPESGYLWTVGPPMYSFNGYDELISEEYIAGYTEKPENVFRFDELEDNAHVKVQNDSGIIYYGVLEKHYDGDLTVYQYFHTMARRIEINETNIKSHKSDTVDYIRSNLNNIDLHQPTSDKSSFYKDQQKINYGNVVKIKGQEQEYNPFWVVVDGNVVPLSNGGHTLESVVLQKLIHDDSPIYKTVNPTDLIYVTLNAGMSSIYKDNQILNTKNLGCLLPKNPNSNNTGGRFLNKILPLSDLESDEHYDGNNTDWKQPDYRILLGDNVKLKNDNTIYKVTNMETITENPDEKVYVYITNDPEWNPNIDYEDNEIKNEQKHLLDDIIFVRRYNNWATYFSKNSHFHRNSEELALELENDYVKYGKTLVLYKPFWNGENDFYIGILKKFSNDSNPRLYVVDAVFKFDGEINHKEYQKLSKGTSDVIYESDIGYIFPDNISIDNPAAIKNTLKESIAIKEENERKKKYLAFQSVALNFQKLIINIFDVFFSKSIKIVGTNKKKNLFDILFIDTVHRKEYHMELKQLEFVIGKIVEKFKDSSKIEYYPREPENIWYDTMEIFERRGQLNFYDLLEKYDVSNKEVKKIVILQIYESYGSPSQEFDYEGYVFAGDKDFLNNMKLHEERKRAREAEWKYDDCMRFHGKKQIINQMTDLLQYFLRFLETIDMSQNENLLFSMGKKFLNTIFGIDFCTTKINSSLCSWMFYAEKKIKESNTKHDINYNVSDSTRHNVIVQQNIPGENPVINSANLQAMSASIRRRSSFYSSCEDPDSIIAYADNNYDSRHTARLNQIFLDRLRNRIPQSLRQTEEGQRFFRDEQTAVDRITQQVQQDRNRYDSDDDWRRTPSYSPERQSPIESQSSTASQSSTDSNTREWNCAYCGTTVEGPTDDFPDGWTMDNEGSEICEECQDNYYTCYICGRMDERGDYDEMPEGWRENNYGETVCPNVLLVMTKLKKVVLVIKRKRNNLLVEKL